MTTQVRDVARITSPSGSVLKVQVDPDAQVVAVTTWAKCDRGVRQIGSLTYHVSRTADIIKALEDARTALIPKVPTVSSCFLHGSHVGEACPECGKQPAFQVKKRVKAKRV